MRSPIARIIPLLVIGSLVVAGVMLDRDRQAKRSVLSGTFESQPSQLAPKITGKVRRVLIHEGDVVKKGQPLVELDASDALLDLEASKKQADVAQAKLEEALAGSRAQEIARQRSAVDELKANYEKLVNGARPEEIASARARVQQAQQKYLETLRGPRPKEIEQARGAVAEAEARLRIARRGPNEQEKEQLQAVLDAANADLRLAQGDLERKKLLADEGALAQQEVRVYQNRLDNAFAKQTQAQRALERARLGSPVEEVRQANAQLQQAQDRLSLLLAGNRQEDVAMAKASLDEANENLKLLLAGTRNEDLDAAQAKLAQARASLNLLIDGTRKEQIAQASAAASSATAQAKAVEVRTNDRVVYAPTDGVVERVLIAVGDLVGPNSPVVQFSNPSDLWLRVYVPETNLAKISRGDKAQLAIDGIGEHVDAVVESISTQGEFTPVNLQTPEERGRQSFAVRIRLAAPDIRAKAGMAATVKSIGGWTP